MEKTTIYLPADLQVQIKHVARLKQTSEANVIREALATYVVQQERPVSRSIGCVTEEPDDGLSPENVKNWVHAQWDSEFNALQERLHQKKRK